MCLTKSEGGERLRAMQLQARQKILAVCVKLVLSHALTPGERECLATESQALYQLGVCVCCSVLPLRASRVPLCCHCHCHTV